MKETVKNHILPVNDIIVYQAHFFSKGIMSSYL